MRTCFLKGTPNKRFEWDAPTAGFAACFRAPQAARYGHYMGNSAKVTVAEDVFLVGQRGLVVTGIWLDESQTLLEGSCLEVRRPDGSTMRAVLRAVDLFTKCFGETRTIGLLLADISDKSQVPLGSELWLLNRTLTTQ